MAKRVTQNSVQSPSRSTSRRASQVASLAATTALVAFSPMTAYGAVDVVKGQHQASNPQLNKVTDMQKRIEAAKVPGVVVDRKLQRAIDLAKRAETSNFMVPVSKKQAKFHETVNANHLKINLSKQMEKQVVVDYMLAGVDANIIAKYGSKIEVLGRSDQTWLANMHNMKSMAELAGTLTSNVPVVLSNPGGFWLKSTGLVDVAKLTLLTGQNARNAFGGQFYNFPNKNAPILIEGTIRVSGQTVHEKGLGVFLGASGGVVLGSGSVILAGLKRVTLASGVESVAVDFANDGLVSFAASDRDLAKSLELTGKILGDKTFDGSVVLMSSDEALTTVRGVMTAPSSATKARVESGEIVLTSNAAAVVGGDLRATHGNKGGRIKIEAPAITLSEDAVVDASGLLIGGNVIIGGDFQGSSKTSKEFIIAHPEIQGVERLAQQEDFTIGYENNARHVVVSKGAKVLAKGETQGGRVIVWSGNTSFDHSATVFLGKLDVSSPKGVGGVFEVSSKGRLAKSLTYKDKSGATVQASGSFINKGAEGSAPGIRLFDPAHLVFAADAATAAGVLGVADSGLTTALGGAAGADAVAAAAALNGGAAAFNLGAVDGDIAAAWASAGGQVAFAKGGGRAFTFAPSGGAGNVANQSVSWIDVATVQGGDTYVADGWIVVASAINALNGNTGGITFSGNLGIELRANVGNGRNGNASNVTLTSGAGPIQVAPGTNAQVLVTAVAGAGQQGRTKIITLTAATFIGTQADPVLVGLSAASATSPNIVVSSTGGGDIYLSGYTNNAAGNIKVQSVNTTGAVTLQGNNIYGSNGGDADALQVNSLQNLTGLTLLYNGAKTVDQAVVDVTLAAVQTPANLTSIGFGTTGANDLTVADADIDFGARNVSLISGQAITCGGVGSTITTTGNLSLNSAGDIAAALNPLSVAVNGTLSINSTAAGDVGITSGQALSLGAVTINNGATAITTTAGGGITLTGDVNTSANNCALTLTSFAGITRTGGTLTTGAGVITLTAAAGSDIGSQANPILVSTTGNLTVANGQNLWLTSNDALSLGQIDTAQGINITTTGVGPNGITTTAAITAAAGDVNISTTAGALIVGAGQAISAAAGNVSLKAIGGDLNLTNNAFSITAAAGGSVFLQGDDIDNWGGGAGGNIAGGISSLSMLYNNPKTLGGAGVDPAAALGLVNGGIAADPFNFTFGVIGGALTIGGDIDLTAGLGANTNLILRGDAINDGAGNDFLNANAPFSRTFSNLAALHLQYNQGDVTVGGDGTAAGAQANDVLLSKINTALAPAVAARITIEALGGTLSTVGAIDMTGMNNRPVTLISTTTTPEIIMGGNYTGGGNGLTLETSKVSGDFTINGSLTIENWNTELGLLLSSIITVDGGAHLVTLGSIGKTAGSAIKHEDNTKSIIFADAAGSLKIDTDQIDGSVTLNLSAVANAPVKLNTITTAGGAVNLTAKNGSGFELTAAVDLTNGGGAAGAAFTLTANGNGSITYNNGGGAFAVNTGAGDISLTAAGTGSVGAALAPIPVTTTGLVAGGAGTGGFYVGSTAPLALGAIASTGAVQATLTTAAPGVGSALTVAGAVSGGTVELIAGDGNVGPNNVGGDIIIAAGGSITTTAGDLILTPGMGDGAGVAGNITSADATTSVTVAGGYLVVTRGNNVTLFSTGAVSLSVPNALTGDFALTTATGGVTLASNLTTPLGVTIRLSQDGAVDLGGFAINTTGVAGAAGGNIQITSAAGVLTVGNGTLTSTGGAVLANNNGQNAGNVTIRGNAGLTISGGALIINALGSDAVGVGALNGGDGGAVVLSALAGDVIFTSGITIDSSGGAEQDAGNAGNSGLIDVTSFANIAGAGLISVLSLSWVVPNAGGTIDMSFAGQVGISQLVSMGAVNISSQGDFYVGQNHQTNGGNLTYTSATTLRSVGNNGQITTGGGAVSLTAAAINFTNFHDDAISTSNGAGNGGLVTLISDAITWKAATTINTSATANNDLGGALTLQGLTGKSMTIDGTAGAFTYTNNGFGAQAAQRGVLTVDGAGGEVVFVLAQIAHSGVYTQAGNVFQNMSALDLSAADVAGFTVQQAAGAGVVSLDTVGALFGVDAQRAKLTSIAIRATAGDLTVDNAVNFGARSVTLQGQDNIGGLLIAGVLQGGITDLALLFDSGAAWDVHAFVAGYIAAVDGAYDSLNSLTIGELGADLKVNAAGVDFAVPGGGARPNKPIALTLRGDDITDENGAALAADSIQGVNALTLQYNQNRTVGVGAGAQVRLDHVNQAMMTAANAPVTIETVDGFTLTFNDAALDWSAVARDLTLISGTGDLELPAGGGNDVTVGQSLTLRAKAGDVNFNGRNLTVGAGATVVLEGDDIVGFNNNLIGGDGTLGQGVGALTVLYHGDKTLTQAAGGGRVGVDETLAGLQMAQLGALTDLTIGTTSGTLTLDNDPAPGGGAAAIDFGGRALTLRGDSIKFESNGVEQEDNAAGNAPNRSVVVTNTNGITLQYNGAQSLGVTNDLDGRLNFLKFKTVLDGAADNFLEIQTMSGDLTLAENVNLDGGGIGIGRNIKLTAAGNLVGGAFTFTTFNGNSLTLVAKGDIGAAVAAFKTAVEGQVLKIVSAGASYVQNATALQLGLVNTSGETIIATLAGGIDLSQDVATNDGALTLTSAAGITQTGRQTIDTGVGVLTLSAAVGSDIGTLAAPIVIAGTAGLTVLNGKDVFIRSSAATIAVNAITSQNSVTLKALNVTKGAGVIKTPTLTLSAVDNAGADAALVVAAGGGFITAADLVGLVTDPAGVFGDETTVRNLTLNGTAVNVNEAVDFSVYAGAGADYLNTVNLVSTGAITNVGANVFNIGEGTLTLTAAAGSDIGANANKFAFKTTGAGKVSVAGGANVWLSSVTAGSTATVDVTGAITALNLTTAGVIGATITSNQALRLGAITTFGDLSITAVSIAGGAGAVGQIATNGGDVLLVANTDIDFTQFNAAAITKEGGTLGLVSMNGGTFNFAGKAFSTVNLGGAGGSVALVAMNGDLELENEGIFDLQGNAVDGTNDGGIVLVSAGGVGHGDILNTATTGQITANNTKGIGFAAKRNVGASLAEIKFGVTTVVGTFNTADLSAAALQAKLTALNGGHAVNIDSVGGNFFAKTTAGVLFTVPIKAGGEVSLDSAGNLIQVAGTTVESTGNAAIALTAAGAIQSSNFAVAPTLGSFKVTTTGAISVTSTAPGDVNVENTGAASTTFGVITTSGATTLTSIGNTTFTDAITTRGGDFTAIVPNGSTTAFTKFGGGIVMVSTSAMAVGGNVVFEDTAGAATSTFGGSVEFDTSGGANGAVDFKTNASSLNAAGLSLAFSGGATQASISVTTGGTLQVVKTLANGTYNDSYGYVAPTPTFTPAAPAVKPAVTPVAPAGSGSGTPSSPSTPGSTPTTPLTPAQVQQTVAQISNLLNQAGVNPSVDQKLISNAESLINNLMSPTGPKGPTGPLLSTADLLGNLANAPTGSLGAGSFGLRPQDDSSNTPVILSASEGPTSSGGLSYSSPQGSTGGTVKSSSPSVVVSVGGSQTITVNQESLTLSLPSLAQQSLSAYVDANGVIQVSPVVQHLMNSFKNNFGVPTIEQSSVLVLPQIIPTLVPGPNGLEIVNQTRGGSTQSVVRSGTFDVTSSMNKAQVISIGSTASSEFYVPGNVPVVAAPQSATHVVLSLSFEEQERIRRAKAAAQAGAPKTEAASQAVVVGSTGGASSSTTSAPTSGGIVIPGNAPASSAAIAVTTTTGPVAITIPAGTSQSAASNSAVVQSAPAAAASGGVVIPGNAPTTATSSGKSVVQTSVEIPSSVAASVASAQASRIISSAATGGFTVGGSAGFAPTPAPSPGDVIIPGNAGVVVIPAKTSAASQASQGASGGGETINIDN